MRHLTIRNLLVGVSAAATVLALATTLPGSSAAEAKTIPEYDMCMLNAYYDCYPLDASGLPRPPNLGDIDEAAQFEQCLATNYPRCSGLPGDPN